ncbi:MAG TPA: aldehyde dehydrogenase family protein, partial [Acidimicrobiia bacterium]|nr:aldehyde dehydrogenase family protein [Acidimicrobiia bacterium]
MIERNAIYIDGAWVPSGGTGTIDVHGAATEEVVGRIPDGVAADVDRAVAAAKAAFPAWAATAPEERAKHLQRLQEGLMARQGELAELIATEVGMPLKLAGLIQVGLPVAQMGNYAQVLREFTFEEQIGNSLVVKEPIGVVGAITPWNYPLNQIVAKVGAALAAGCTIVLKPSEVAPLNAFVLADVIDEVGLP